MAATDRSEDYTAKTLRSVGPPCGGTVTAIPKLLVAPRLVLVAPRLVLVAPLP